MSQWFSLMSRRGRLFLLFVGAVLLICSHRAVAQGATVVGTVTDVSGAVVPKVSITITNLDTGLATTLVTAGDGQYVAPDLAIGHYTVKAAASGFKATEKTGVVLTTGDRVRLDFQLQVGAAAQTVTVAADAIHL